MEAAGQSEHGFMRHDPCQLRCDVAETERRRGLDVTADVGQRGDERFEVRAFMRTGAPGWRSPSVGVDRRLTAVG